MPSGVGVDWRYAVGVEEGLNSPVLEVGALAPVFKVSSMVEGFQGPHRHGCREGSQSTALRAHGTERQATREPQRGNITTSRASS